MSATPKIKVSLDDGKTWQDYVKATSPTSPTTTTTTTIPPTAIVMHANWLSNAEFDQIANSLTATDQVQYRCTNYPTGYNEERAKHVMTYKSKGLKIGIDVGYYNNVTQNASKFKSLGYDVVDYNIEAAFDGPNADSEAANNVEKIRKASQAAKQAGLLFRISPGRPNSTSFMRTKLLDDVAKLVDHYHIQCQTMQDTTPEEYANFTESVAKILRAANPKIVVTSQVSPAQGAAPGKTLQQTMRDVIVASMAKPAPGNTNGVRMWIGGEDVQEASSFFSWFKAAYKTKTT